MNNKVTSPGPESRTSASLKEGKTLGRRPVVVDVASAKKMRKDGLGIRPIAAKLGISVNTLRQSL